MNPASVCGSGRWGVGGFLTYQMDLMVLVEENGALLGLLLLLLLGLHTLILTNTRPSQT